MYFKAFGYDLIHVISLPISFRIASLALGQSYDCPSANEVTLEDMGKIDQNHTTTKHSKTWSMCIFPGMLCQ